jgi:signal recognition particle subunit SRP19
LKEKNLKEMAAPQADTKNWIVIYPVYLDSTKTVAEGRKATKDTAVSKPTLAEIATCIKKLGLLCVEEPEKAYSRDPVMEVGRVKIQLKTGTTPVNPDITSRTFQIITIRLIRSKH